MGTKERLEILRDMIEPIENWQYISGTRDIRKSYFQNLLDEKDKEIERLTCDNESLSSNNSRLAKIILEAIEYIEKHRIGNEYSYEYDLFQRNARTSDLLSILKGEDKE